MIRCLPLLMLFACASSPEPRESTPTGEPGVPTTSSPAGACEPFDAAFEADLQQGLEEAWTAQGIPGAALAVLRPSTNQCWTSSVGLADVDAQIPWTPELPYPVGSTTKTLTAALGMQLVESGALSLDDPLEAYVDTVWGGQGVTIEHLLAHTSGIASYNYVGSFDSSRVWSPEGLVDWAATVDPALHFAPGSQWEYSNTNYVLLGLIAESVTGSSYASELDARFLGPLGLAHTWLADANPPDLVRGYAGAPLQDATDDDHPTMGWAAGGLISTPMELALWGGALFTGRVLEPDSLARMQTPLVIDSVDTGYGLGLFGTNDPEFGPHWGHTGGTGGHLTYLYYLERQDTVVVAMANSFEGSDLDALAEAAWRPVLGM